MKKSLGTTHRVVSKEQTYITNESIDNARPSTSSNTERNHIFDFAPRTNTDDSFTIIRETGRAYSQFNTLGRDILVRFKPLIANGFKINNAVDNLLTKTCINLSGGEGREHLDTFQRYFGDQYKIRVYNTFSTVNGLWYEGILSSTRFINLLYDDVSHHFNVIINIAVAFSVRYFCDGCNTSFERGARYSCKSTCPQCMSTPPCFCASEKLYCSDCNIFYGLTLVSLDRIKFAVGKRRQVCSICDKTKGRNHECFKSYCATCKQNKDNSHRCYMQTLSRKELDDKYLMVFYDFETRQDHAITDDCFISSDVFRESITISSACNRLFRKLFLGPDTIAILSKVGHSCGGRQHLGGSCLYCDMASIISVIRPTDTYTIPTGDMLGDMTNELTAYSETVYITEFDSGGHNNYS
ncbi:unnamed protein product [Timema podura]|uniref:Uncharacterized protein n=1 Tax=Timema podura TaxID=61482 RepID=A0ABN7NUD8_TIMPD|nr:unnamed protein product [Timema podura]